MDLPRLKEFYRLVDCDPYLSSIPAGMRAKEDIVKGDFEIAVARLLAEENVIRRASEELTMFLDKSRPELYKTGYADRSSAIDRANSFTLLTNQQHRFKKDGNGLWYVYNAVDK